MVETLFVWIHSVRILIKLHAPEFVWRQTSHAKKTGFPSNFPKLWGHGVRMARFERRKLPAPSWSSCLVGATSFGPQGPQGSAATIDLTVTSLEWRLGLGESSPNSPTVKASIFRWMNDFLIQPDPRFFWDYHIWYIGEDYNPWEITKSQMAMDHFQKWTK